MSVVVVVVISARCAGYGVSSFFAKLFSLNNNFSVNKFKRFLLNFFTKHMVNASLSIAELWMHSGDSGLLSSQQLEELRIVY